MKKTFIIVFIFCSFHFFCPKLLFAQPPSFDNDTSDVPIDGGLSMLLALGIGYGIKKNFKQEEAKKNKPAPNE
ncbi:MAG: hypothetical protein WCJ80_00570 [Bacteroidota bacterium]